MSCDKSCLGLNPIGQLQAISRISSRNFYVGRHTLHIRVHILWLVLFCTMVQLFIYFCWSVRTSFRLFRVSIISRFQIFQFWKICNPVILWSTSEANIWLSIVTFSTFIFRVAWVEIWIEFLIELSLSLYLQTLLSWVQYCTMTAYWVREVFLFMYLLLNCINLSNNL